MRHLIGGISSFIFRHVSTLIDMFYVSSVPPIALGAIRCNGLVLKVTRNVCGQYTRRRQSTRPEQRHLRTTEGQVNGHHTNRTPLIRDEGHRHSSTTGALTPYGSTIKIRTVGVTHRLHRHTAPASTLSGDKQDGPPPRIIHADGVIVRHRGNVPRNNGSHRIVPTTREPVSIIRRRTRQRTLECSNAASELSRADIGHVIARLGKSLQMANTKIGGIGHHCNRTLGLGVQDTYLWVEGVCLSVATPIPVFYRP